MTKRKISPTQRHNLARGRQIGAFQTLAPILAKKDREIKELKLKIYLLTSQVNKLKSAPIKKEIIQMQSNNSINLSLFKKLIGFEISLFGRKTTIPQAIEYLKTQITKLFNNDEVLNNRINKTNREIQKMKDRDSINMNKRNKKFDELSKKISELEKEIQELKK